MKVAVTLSPSPPIALMSFSDVLKLVRPRLALMAVVTTACGWLIAGGWERNWPDFAATMIGISLSFAGASAFNQVLEQESDALMPRTSNRPLPAGRIRPMTAIAWGSIFSASGMACLLANHQSLAATLCFVAFVGYVLIYTPLKRRTTLSTLIGAIPGALLPTIGWTGALHQLDGVAIVLFLIVFFWQIPHFLAIAWIYRNEYANAGLYVLPVFDPNGVQTGSQMIRYSIGMIAACLMYFVLGHGSWISGVTILSLSILFLTTVVSFAHAPSTEHARRVFRTSLLILPGVLLVFVLDATLFSGT